MLILPFAVLLFNYLYARGLLQKENLSYQNAVLLQAQKMIDEKLQAMQLFVLDLSNDKNISEFLRSNELVQSDLQVRVWELSSYLSRYSATYRDLCQVYIYSMNYDCLIGTTGADFKVSDAVIRLDSDELNLQLQQKLMEPRQFCQYSTLRDDEDSVLVMLHSVPLWSTGVGENGTICLLIDTENLLQHVASMPELQNGLVCLIDETGQPIMSTGQLALFDAFLQENSPQHGFLTINGDQYTISTATSEIGGWQYLSIQPQHAVLPRLRLTRNLSILVFVCVLSIGCGAAYLLSRKNYHPLENLMNVLRRQAGVLRYQVDNENEFDLIERSVTDITTSMSTLQTLLQDEMPYMQESMLLQLLRNAVTDYTSFSSTLSNLGILLPYKKFAVAVIRQVEVDHKVLEEQALVCVVMKEQLVKVMPHTMTFAAVTVQNDTLAIILNSDSDTLEQDAEAALRNLAEQMRSEFSCMVNIALSRTFAGIERVPHAYYTAAQCSTGIPGSVVLLSKQPPARVEHLPDELSTPLQNTITTGNAKQALQLLRHSYHYSIEGRALPIHTLRAYYVNLLNVILTSLSQDILDTIDSSDWLEMLFWQSDAVEMQNTVETVTLKLCNSVQERQKGHASQLTDQILDFMRKEYSNSELTLSYVADHFYITSSYLSTFFKENVGETFLNYLTRLRIDSAKELIRTTNLPMGEIAVRVGYASGNTFTRIFKKLEHITPTQYRESFLRDSQTNAQNVP